jgi:Replication initiator protein A
MAEGVAGPKRRGPRDALRAPRRSFEGLDILQAYRMTLEALRLPSPGYLEQAVEDMRAAPPDTVAEPAHALRGGPATPEWIRFRGFLERAFLTVPMDPNIPLESEERAAQVTATAYFVGAWGALTVAFGIPHAPLAPVIPEAAIAAVSSTVGMFQEWREQIEHGAPLWGEVEGRGVTQEQEIVSPKAVQLAYMEAAVAMETNLARAPIFSGGRHRGHLQLSLERVGSLYGRPFNVLEPKGPLTVQDAQLLAHLLKRYAEEGFPSDRRVRMSLSEAARASGYKGEGGRQRELVRRAFMRMRATTYQNVVRLPDGTVKSLTWGLIDWAATYEPSEETGRALVTLSEPLVNLIQAGSLVYLQEDVFAELVRRDEYGARLWVFLESESLSSPRDYLLFSAPEGEPERERDTPAIADLLRIDWSRRRKVKDRIAEAAQVIREEDPLYTLSVEKAYGKGMWKLRAKKAVPPKGYYEGRNRVPPGAQPGTPRGAVPPLSPVKPEVLEGVPSVLPSDIPSERRYDFLEKQLREAFGVPEEDLRNPESDWYKTLERASRLFGGWIPQYFGGVSPEDEEELLRRLLREMVADLRDKSPEDPLRYLSHTIAQARTPGGLLIEDYALESLKAWVYREQREGRRR